MMTEKEFKSLCRDVGEKPLATLIELARELRTGSDEAEQKFLLFCVALDRSGKWREGSTAATFEAFLDKIELCKPSR